MAYIVSKRDQFMRFCAIAAHDVDVSFSLGVSCGVPVRGKRRAIGVSINIREPPLGTSQNTNIPQRCRRQNSGIGKNEKAGTIRRNVQKEWVWYGNRDPCSPSARYGDLGNRCGQ